MDGDARGRDMQPFKPEIAIRYDAISRLASINIHGIEIFLQERFQTREQAVRAGEAFCRKHVLMDAPRPTAAASHA